MHDAVTTRHCPVLVQARDNNALDVLGPTIEFLTTLDGNDASPCVMRSTVPAGVVVPLHSHPDPETFILISGVLETVTHEGTDVAWTLLAEGDTFHVPPDVRHAIRNPSPSPTSLLIVSTVKIGRLFREIGVPCGTGAPPGATAPERVHHFLRTAERYGYWIATPEQNAEIGIFPGGGS